MTVIHLATVDGGNGAAIAAYRLHRGLCQLGINSKMFVAHKHTDDPDVIPFRPSSDFISDLRRRMQHIRIARSTARNGHANGSVSEAFSDDRSVHGADVLKHLPAGDVINIHAMLNFVDYRAFFRGVPRHIPVVRTLHDMSFFTGGCHYNGDCDRYTERCGACPQLTSHKEHDLSRQIWHRKQAAFNAVRPGRLHIVATSRWLAREAQRSSLLRRFPITVIPYSLDTDAFSPRDRRSAREIFGIPQLARVVLFVAEPVTRRMKGFTQLAQALEGLGHMRDLLFVSVGSGHPPVRANVPHMHLGQIGQERLLSMAYSAADVFVIPSSQEAFGLTALEATACGTPVIGFAVGGILDTIRPGVTGLLVPNQDVSALRDAISALLEDPARREELAANCRRVAVKEYSLEIQAERYAALYRAILSGQHSVPSQDYVKQFPL